jgi:hypothetical protein
MFEIGKLYKKNYHAQKQGTTSLCMEQAINQLLKNRKHRYDLNPFLSQEFQTDMIILVLTDMKYSSHGYHNYDVLFYGQKLYFEISYLDYKFWDKLEVTTK